MGNRAARGELVGLAPSDRLREEVLAALKRKPSAEARLAGVVRALSPLSASLRATLADVLETLVARGSYSRSLYAATVRSLAEAGDRRMIPAVRKALFSEEAGGLATLSAACCLEEPALAEPLARIAGSRHAQLAFAAEVARLARGESTASHIASLAP